MLLPSLSGELSNLGYIPWPGEGKSIKNEKKKYLFVTIYILGRTGCVQKNYLS